MNRKLLVALLILTFHALRAPESTLAQGTSTIPAQQNPQSSISRYYDSRNGLSADDAVSYALAHNGELGAFRSEVEAARGLVQQASLRPNPQLEVERKEQVNGADNDTMVGAMLPLELGGRRSARILVAQRELELKQSLLADRERLLAAEVRAKFGEALGELLKLGFTEDLLTTTDQGYRLVAARVVEGRTAPLEQNMVLVEVNRIRSLRESGQGKVEVAMLELRNLMGMRRASSAMPGSAKLERLARATERFADQARVYRTLAKEQQDPELAISLYTTAAHVYETALGHRVTTTNLQRVLLRRGVLEPTGGRRDPGRTGGRPAALYRFRERTLQVTDPFAVLRPPNR